MISPTAFLYAAPDATLKWAALLGVVFLGVWNLPSSATGSETPTPLSGERTK